MGGGIQAGVYLCLMTCDLKSFQIIRSLAAEAERSLLYFDYFLKIYLLFEKNHLNR